jgi:hypothetical protein
VRALLVHVWKEWREHRAVLLGIAVAVPLLTFLGVWALTPQWTTIEKVWPVFVAGSVVLTALLLATEMWAGETQRGTLSFLRRTPGGLRVALVGKLVAYAGLCATTALLARLSYVVSAHAVSGGDVLVPEILPVEMWSFAAPVVVAGLWILFVSTSIPRGAAAAAAALLLVGALLVPAWLVHRDWESFLPSDGFVTAVLWLAVALPLAALALGVRGHRFLGNSWRAIVAGVVLVLAGTGVAYGLGMRELDRWIDLRPGDPDTTILSAFASPSGRYLYANVGRSDVRGTYARGTVRPWRIDLETGTWTRIEAPESWVDDATHDANHLAWASVPPSLLAVQFAGTDTVRYLDADTGDTWKTLPATLRPPALVERLRDEARRRTPVRLADGHPVWILDRSIEHDGLDGRVVSCPLPDDLRAGWAYRWGWQGYTRSNGKTVAIGVDGDGKPVVHPWNSGGWMNSLNIRVTAARYLSQLNVREKSERKWHIVDAATGVAVVATGLEATDYPLHVLDERSLLVRGAADGSQRFPVVVVDLATGARRELTLPDGTPLRPLRATTLSVKGMASDGSAIVWIDAGRDPSGFLVLDPAGFTVRSWTPCGEYVALSPSLAWADARSGLFVRGHEVTRLEWGHAFTMSTRTVLFPR